MNRDARLWMKLMLIAFVANGLGPFGLKVLSERKWRVPAAISVLLVPWRAILRSAGAFRRLVPRESQRSRARRLHGSCQSLRPGFHRAGAVA